MFVNDELLKLMENFYILTGIRIALFDENYSEIMSYPEVGIPFCSVMRKNGDFYNKCCESDKISFIRCKKTQNLSVYKCHAGLIEATAPIIDNGVTIGYIMFGQIADNADKDDFIKKTVDYCNGFMPDMNIENEVRKIKHKTNKQIEATSSILLACTSYILLKQMIKLPRKKIFSSIDNYIIAHLNEPLNVDILCSEFNMSRTKLYEVMSPYTNGGIATYIKKKRLDKAHELLLNTKKSISQIAYETGFSDYNYFIHVFKKRFNISPKQLRKNAEKDS